MDAFRQLHTPDSYASYNAYTSTSRETYDPSMQIQLVITSKRGKDISAWNSNEQEVLFPRDAYFRVTKIDGNVFYMEEV